ncbi:MAG: MFS transporter [Xenococcaceae cyanobacterium MO_188.B29]|nr:MFS transporter [Xenococcaceae cyanobacterium MO_188.B29]
MKATNIQWRRISGIVAVQGSITLAWVIYALYLPNLLMQLGFSKSLAGIILIIEHALEAVIEPISGGLSDRSFQLLGTREPLIKLGVILAATFFLILPWFGFFIEPVSVWRWSLPVIAVLWASAMAIFRSPVIALLRLATPQPKLPIAASCLTLVQQLIGAFRFTAYNLILSAGPLFTFALGSFVLLGATVFLRRVTPPIAPQNTSQTLPKIPIRIVVLVVGVGIAIGWSLRFLMAGLAIYFGQSASSGLLGFSLLLAIFAVPAGRFAVYVGNTRLVLGGMILTAILLKLVLSASSIFTLVIGSILMALAFSSVLNGIVPFVLELVPETRAGLGLGIYFGAFGGAISFFNLFFKGLNNLSLQTSLGAISLIVAGFFVAISLRFKDRKR